MLINLYPETRVIYRTISSGLSSTIFPTPSTWQHVLIPVCSNHLWSKKAHSGSVLPARWSLCFTHQNQTYSVESEQTLLACRWGTSVALTPREHVSKKGNLSKREQRFFWWETSFEFQSQTTEHPLHATDGPALRTEGTIRPVSKVAHVFYKLSFSCQGHASLLPAQASALLTPHHWRAATCSLWLSANIILKRKMKAKSKETPGNACAICHTTFWWQHGWWKSILHKT